MKERSLPLSPYKGLMPYGEEDAPFFFGREETRKVITANLMASRLTVLYGPSGVGKSSVLRAGVAHQLRREIEQALENDKDPEFAIVVFSSWRDDPVLELVNSIRDSVAQVLNGQTLDHIAPRPTLTQSLQTWTKLTPDNKRPNIDLLIILDQFEEYFLYHPNEAGEGTFATEFPQVVLEPNLCVNFLISIRDDALAKLDFFKGRIPNLFDNRLSIEHLDQKSARDAIVKPLKEYNRLTATSAEDVIEPESVEAVLTQDGRQVGVEPALVDAILEQIVTGRVLLGQTGRGTVESSSASSPGEAQIETPYLQLVLSRLWEAEMAATSRIMRLDTLIQLGGASRIVQSHLDQTMNSLPRSEQEIAARIFYHLVTPSGTKIAHSVADLALFADLSQGQLTSVLAKLSDSPERILRPIAAPTSAPSAERYEIFHDVLAPAILDWRVRHIQAQRQSEAEKQAAARAAESEREASTRLQLEHADKLAQVERQRAEEKQRRIEQQAGATKRLRWLTVALAVMFLLAVAAMIFALTRKSEAEANADAAAVARDLAEVSRGSALEEKKRAEEQTQLAELGRQTAEDLRQLASSRAAEAVRAKRKLGSLIDQVRTNLEGEALNLEARGDSSKAIELYDHLLPIYQKAGVTERQVEVLTISARLYRRLGQVNKAKEFEALLKTLQPGSPHRRMRIKTKP